VNRKALVAIALGLVAISGAYLLFKHAHSGPSVTTTIRVSVTPPDQLDFVVSKANSALFKYMMSKKTGIKPAAQQLVIKSVPGSSVLEATIGVMTAEEGKKYSDNFIDTLQDACAKQAQVALAADPAHK
jgi:hypothetical protein